MGMFSWFCKGGCGKPIKMDEEVVQLHVGPYGGYGNVEGCEDRGVFYHQVCFEALVADAKGQDALTDYSEGESDPDQGFGYPDARFLPAGAKLYEQPFAVFGTMQKVGVLIDTAAINADLMRFALPEVEAAFHYLAVQEAEVITFDSQVQIQKTLPADDLWKLRHDHAGEWKQSGPGGTLLQPAIEAALAAGCTGLVIVSDCMIPAMPSAPDVPVVWVRLVNSEIESEPSPGQEPGWGGIIDVAYWRPYAPSEEGA
jgi:hypothetical protein